MANDDRSAGDRWARTVMGEIRRFQSLGPARRGRVFRYTPMPPAVRASVNKSLALWPLSQVNRDAIVVKVAQRISGVKGPPQRPHGFIPEPEASQVAAAAEAEGFAAATAYAAGKSALDTDEERADVVRLYCKEVWCSAYRYAASRNQQAAAGTSGSGPAAVPPPAASVVAASSSGPVVQRRGRSPSLRRRVQPPPQE